MQHSARRYDNLDAPMPCSPLAPEHRLAIASQAHALPRGLRQSPASARTAARGNGDASAVGAQATRSTPQKCYAVLRIGLPSATTSSTVTLKTQSSVSSAQVSASERRTTPPISGRFGRRRRLLQISRSQNDGLATRPKRASSCGKVGKAQIFTLSSGFFCGMPVKVRYCQWGSRNPLERGT
jgi:hypothetical protein